MPPESSTGTEGVVEDVKIDAAESSTPAAVEQDANTQAAAPSTADEGAKAPESMLEAVKAAIEPPKTEAAAAGSEAGSPDAKGGEAESDASKTADKAEEEPPFHKHPRWQELKAKERTLEARLKELEPEAETFKAFKASVADAGLVATEIDQGFDIMRLMKSDPVKAYEKLKPYMDTLEAFVGNRLPADLQTKVDAGTVDAETAQELARTRAQQGFAVERSRADEERAERDAEVNERQALQTHLNKCADAVTAVENEWKAGDPDYAKKSKLILHALTALNVERGFPKTVDEAVGRAKEARKTVDDTLGPVLRKTTEKRVIGGGSSAGQAAPAPKTMHEAIRLAAKGQYKTAA